MAGMTIKQKREDYSLSLDSALNKILAQLSQIPEIQKVILFGSYATGRRDLFTDIDILVVMDTPQDFIHRTADLYARIETDVDLDMLVYSSEEFMKNKGNNFVRRALATGQVIYEKKSS